MRLHCLARGVERSLQSGGAGPNVFSDPARLFRTLVASTADPMLIQTFDRVQATLERFAPAEAELLDDMPEALEQISALLGAGDTASAATLLEAFHERRIRAAPILTERGPIAVEAG